MAWPPTLVVEPREAAADTRQPPPGVGVQHPGLERNPAGGGLPEAKRPGLLRVVGEGRCRDRPVPACRGVHRDDRVAVNITGDCREDVWVAGQGAQRTA